MKNELTILNALQKTLRRGLSAIDGLPSLDSGQVALDFPDTDRMPFNTMVYIVPDYANYGDLSSCSDEATFVASAIIVCKKDSADNLTRKVYGYYNAVYAALMADLSLDNNIDFTRITDADFFPAVEGHRDVQAIEVKILMKYTKDY